MSPPTERNYPVTISDLSQRIQARDGAAVVLYSKPNCQPCRMTKRKLDAAGIYYTEVDVTADATALAYVKDMLGYTGAPVVYVSTIEGDYHWYGLDVARIEKYITKRAVAA
jgi:glutaredoxin-like protein NrdH